MQPETQTQHPNETPNQTQTPNQRTAGLAAIAIPPAGRAVLVGKTGSGKSVLAAKLIAHWRATNPHPRILVIDSKPRFRGEMELNGLSAGRRYRKWQRGEMLPGSVVLPGGVHVREGLRQTWRLGFDTALAQIPNLAYIDWQQAAMGWFYEDSDDAYQQLLYIDELADHFSSSGAYGRGNVLVQAVRSGRERGVAVMAATQRPTGVPQSFFSEASRVYLFRLRKKADLDHLQESILPETIRPPAGKHSFLVYDDDNETSAVYRLRLEGGD